MATDLTKTQWIEILLNRELTTEIGLSIFQALYSFEGHKAYASQIGMILGYKGKSPHGPLNLEIGRYAKRIAKYYDIEFTERSNRKYKFWNLFFNGWNDKKYFVWQLKPQLAEALKETKLTGEFQFADELPTDDLKELKEGIKRTVLVNSYERNPKARQLCVEYWGLSCYVCEINFEKLYGEIGKGFIHVHHLIPVSQIGELYQIDPIQDLRPVCPNCHSMLHKKTPPLKIEELKDMMSRTIGKNT